jgi:hypothetical protein
LSSSCERNYLPKHLFAWNSPRKSTMVITFEKRANRFRNVTRIHP